RNFPPALRLLELRHRVARLLVSAVAALLQQRAAPLRVHARVDQQRALACAPVRGAGLAGLAEIHPRADHVVRAREHVAEVRAARDLSQIAASLRQLLGAARLALVEQDGRERDAGPMCAFLAGPFQERVRAARVLRAADAPGEDLAEVSAGARAVRLAQLLQARERRARIRILSLAERERSRVVRAPAGILAFAGFPEERGGAPLVAADAEAVAQAAPQLVAGCRISLGA